MITPPPCSFMIRAAAWEQTKTAFALVTGGTRGIGLAIVKKYLENGANVVVMGSRKETVDKALAGLTEYEGRVMGLWPDLCDPEAVRMALELLMDRLAQRAGPLAVDDGDDVQLPQGGVVQEPLHLQVRLVGHEPPDVQLVHLRAGSWASGPISATRRRWRRPSPP